MVGLRRRLELERAPEAGDAIPRLASQHALVAEVDRGVGVELQQEEVAELRGVGQRAELEQARQPSVALDGRLDQGRQSTDQLHRPMLPDSPWSPSPRAREPAGPAGSARPSLSRSRIAGVTSTSERKSPRRGAPGPPREHGNRVACVATGAGVLQVAVVAGEKPGQFAPGRLHHAVQQAVDASHRALRVESAAAVAGEVGDEGLEDGEMVARREGGEVASSLRRGDPRNLHGESSRQQIALDVPGQGASGEEVLEPAETEARGAQREGGDRGPPPPLLELVQVGGGVGVGEGRREAELADAAEEAVPLDQGKQPGAGEGAQVAADDLCGVAPGEQGRLAGGALRQSRGVERGVERRQPHAAVQPDLLSGQRSAEQAPQGRRRRFRQRVVGTGGRQADAVDEDEEQPGGHVGQSVARGASRSVERRPQGSAQSTDRVARSQTGRRRRCYHRPSVDPPGRLFGRGHMHRSGLLQILATYAAEHPAECATVERFLAFVRSQPACFARQLEPGHVTASAWLVDRTEARVLLTHHRQLDRWIQLGGHADGDPDVAAVSLREAAEESGLDALEVEGRRAFDVDVHDIPAWGTVPAHLHFDVRFVVRHRGSGDFKASPESKALAWFDVRRLAVEAEEATIRRMAGKWLARGRTT